LQGFVAQTLGLADQPMLAYQERSEKGEQEDGDEADQAGDPVHRERVRRRIAGLRFEARLTLARKIIGIDRDFS
jgi:hypothetical protein